MPRTEGNSRHRAFFIAVGVFLIIWMAGLLAIASAVIPDLYWFSYYSIDYGLGFVRRGLAGQLVKLFAPDDYFTGLKILRWIPTLAYSAGLAVLMRTVAVASGRSERRLMMAILIPVLPFGFTFALFSARPDLLGATALILLAVVVRISKQSRTIIAASALYGISTAIFALAHEATPLLFGLGVLVTFVVLGSALPRKTMVASAVLALAPGLAATFAVAVLGRRGISRELCETIPHGAVNWPASGKPTVGQVLSGFHFDVDYHDWICRNIAPYYDQSFGDAVRFVLDIGPVLLLAATAIGVLLAATSILAIAHVSGVPFSRMVHVLRSNVAWPIAGLILFAPVFMTGVDWIRWWITIALNVGVVFLLYASSESESEIPPTRRTFVTYAIGIVLLALLPVGILPGFGAPVPV